MTGTVSSKGQVTLPAEVRRLLGIRAGTRLQFIVRDDRLELVRVDLPVQALKSILPRPRRKASLRDIQEGIVKGALRTMR